MSEQMYVDPEEHLNVGSPVLRDRYEVLVDTPGEGRWTGVAVLPNDATGVVELLHKRASRTVAWMRTTLEHMRYTDDKLEDLVRQAKNAGIRIGRQWKRYTEADEQLRDAVWVETFPRKAGQMKTQRFDAAGRILFEVTELSPIWDEFRDHYEYMRNGW